MIRTLPVTVNGRAFTLRYPFSPLMEQSIRATLGGEYPFLPFLQEESGVILDVGANIGCASVLFHALYPRTTILALEPGPETFAFLRDNTVTLPAIRPFPFGLFDRDGTARLYRGAEASVTNSIGHSAMNRAEYDEVRLRRISTFLDEQGIGPISLLKVDAEGAEVPILRDIEDRLARVSVVCVEYHSESDRREIDHLLSPQFTLFGGTIYRCHLGVLTYVRREVVRERTTLDRLAIARPRIEGTLADWGAAGREQLLAPGLSPPLG